MSKMAELHRLCVELLTQVENAEIDISEAVEIICEQYPTLSWNSASKYLLEVRETL